jgi:hypothetical protein
MRTQKQVRAETPHTVDQKESFWLKRDSQWPTESQVPGFSKTTSNFMTKCAAISAQVRKHLLTRACCQRPR